MNAEAQYSEPHTLFSLLGLCTDPEDREASKIALALAASIVSSSSFQLFFIKLLPVSNELSKAAVRSIVIDDLYQLRKVIPIPLCKEHNHSLAQLPCFKATPPSTSTLSLEEIGM